jgi:TATA-box binding protein (TBP) (component of TFIID and TFIIIB)
MAVAYLKQYINLELIANLPGGKYITYDNHSRASIRFGQALVNIERGGAIVSVGTKSIKEAVSTLRLTKTLLVDRGIIHDISIDRSIFIRNIYARYDLGVPIDIELLQAVLTSNNVRHRKQLTPGVGNLYAFSLDTRFKRLSEKSGRLKSGPGCAVYPSGKLVIMGCESMVQVRRVYRRILGYIQWPMGGNSGGCPLCHSTHISLDGMRYNKNYKIQKLLCVECRHRWSVENKHRVKIPYEMIKDLYAQGNSTRRIARILKQEVGLDLHSATVWRALTH